MCADWIFPCSYGIYVGAAQPLVEEVIFTAEFHADCFDQCRIVTASKGATSCVGSLLQQLRLICMLINPGSHGPVIMMLLFCQHIVVFRLYVVSLIQQTQSVSLVNSAVYSVSWVHKKSSYQEPSEYPVVKEVVAAAGQILLYG